MKRSLVACADVSEYVNAVVSTASRSRALVPVIGAPDDPRLVELAAFANTVVLPWRSIEREVPPSADAAATARVVLAGLVRGSTPDARANALRTLANVDGSDRVASGSITESDVVVALDDDFAILGAALARLDHRPFLLAEDALAVPERTTQARSVAIVGAPESFPPETLGTLIGYGGFDANATMHAPFGILTGHSLASLSRTIAKKFVYTDSEDANAKMLSIFDRPITARTEDGIELTSLRSLSAEQAKRLVEERFDLVTIGTHGDAIDADLNEAVLCGKPSRPVPTRTSAGRRALAQLHTCSKEDHCPRNRGGEAPRIAIDSIKSRLLAAETCTGVVLTGGVVPDDRSLALGALEGVPAALLSTTKIIRGTAVGPLLVPALAKCGMPLGEIADVLRRTHASISGDVASFILLGDPTLRLVESAVPPAPVRATVAKRPAAEGGGYRIETPLDPAPGGYVRVDAFGDLAAAIADDPGVALTAFAAAPKMPDPAGETTALVVRHTLGAPLSILLLAARPFSLLGARFDFADESAEHAAIERTIAEIEDNLFVTRLMQKSAAAAKGRQATPERAKQAADLAATADDGEHLLGDVSGALHARRFPVHNFPIPWNTADVRRWLDGKVAELDARVASLWPSWSMPHFLVPQYAAGLVARGKEAIERHCYMCNGSLFDMDMRAVRRPSLRRFVSHCGRCGIVSDRPAGEALLEIVGPNEIVRGTSVVQRLVVKNLDDEPRTFAAMASIEGKHAWFSGQVATKAMTTTIAPGEIAEIPFELTVDATTTAGTYNALFATSSRLATNMSVKPMLVIESSAPIARGR